MESSDPDRLTTLPPQTEGDHHDDANDTAQPPNPEPLEGRALLSGAGDLDPTFGTGGIAVTSWTSKGSGIALGAVVQPDGRIVAVGGTGLVRYNTNGTLDASFGSGGKVTSAKGNAVALYPAGTANAGKLVTAGMSTSNKTGNDFSLTRYNANGTVDTTFGTNGKVTTDFGNTGDSAQAVLVQPDGKVVAAGMSTNALHFALARYNADGSLDTSFGTGGKVVTVLPSDYSPVYNYFHDITLQADGKILACGGDGNFEIVRYNANGSLDTSFGPAHTGILILSPSVLLVHPEIEQNPNTGFPLLLVSAVGVKVQPDGKIVAAGATQGNNGSGSDGLIVARFDAAGNLDTTFGVGGTTFFRPDVNAWDYSYPYDLALQGNGNIVVLANPQSSHDHFYMARLDGTGALDASFGTGGIVTTSVGTWNYAGRLAVQGDGKIIAAGSTNLGSRNTNWMLARYLGSSTVTAMATTLSPSTAAVGTSPGMTLSIASGDDSLRTTRPLVPSLSLSWLPDRWRSRAKLVAQTGHTHR